LNGKLVGKEKWYSREKVEENLLTSFNKIFWGPKYSINVEV
jgi:hypothetical protein